MALIAAHLNAGHSGGDSVTIGIYSPSSPTSIPPSRYSPSLISLMVSVDVKHHVYLLTETIRLIRDGEKGVWSWGEREYAAAAVTAVWI